MPQALFHFVTHGARVLIDTKKSGRPILARYKHFTTIRAHTTESSPIVSLSSGGIKCSSMHGVAICWREDTIFLMTRRKIFQRIVRHDLPYHSSKQWSFPMNVFFRLVVFVNLSCRISWTTRFWTELLVDQPLPSFACNPNTLDPSSFLSTSRHSQVGIAMPSLVKKNCFHSFFPTGGRLVGDHTSFFQEVPLDLQYHSNLLVFVVEVFWSKFQDIRLSAFVTIWEHRSCWLECTLKLRHLFLQPYQEALRWCPRTLPLPSETQKHLALWMALCVLRLWRCHLRAQLAPCISGGVLQVRRSFSDKGPSDSRVQEDDFQRFSFQIDALLSYLSRSLGSTQAMFQKELMVRHIAGHISSRMLSWHRPSCRARCASNNSIPSQSHHFSGSPHCTRATAVPSFTLRTALSATPFASERWSVLVSWFQCESWKTFIKSLELSM